MKRKSGSLADRFFRMLMRILSIDIRVGFNSEMVMDYTPKVTSQYSVEKENHP